MRRFALLAALLLAPSLARAQFFDGLPVVGVAPAPALSASDILSVCQGGTVGRPGTCTPRQTTAGSLAGVIPAITLSSPPPIGDVAPNTGAFTNLTVTGTVSGAGFTANFASPPPLGNVAPNTVAATALTVFSANGTGTATIGAGGASNHIVLSAALIGTAPTLTTTGTNGFHIAAGAGTVSVTSPFSTTPGTIAWSGSLSNLQGIISTQLHNGTSTVTPLLNRFLITDNVSTTAGTGHSAGIQELYNFGASTGGKLGLDIQAVQTAANTDSGADNYYTGMRVQTFGRFTQPGSSSTNPIGRIFGFNATGAIQGGFVATNLYQVAAAEFNVAISAGSSAAIRSGITIADLVGTSQGTVSDNMLWLYGSGTPWRSALMFGDSQPWPIDAAGTIIGANIGGNSSVAEAAKWFADFDQIGFPATGNPYDGGFFRTNGASLDGAGTLRLGTTYLTPSAAGLSIAAKGSVGTGAAIAAAGSGYAAAVGAVQAFTTAVGGTWLVTMDVTGVPISVAVVSQPAIASTTPPANPIATIALNRASQGTGLTFNLTWNTTGTTLALQPGAGLTTVGGALTMAATKTITTSAGGGFTSTSGAGTVTIASGIVTAPFAKLTGNYTYAGTAPANANTPLFVSANYSGATNGSAWTPLAEWAINTDTLDVGAAQQAIGLNVQENFGGVGITGSRTGLRWQLTMVGAAAAHANYQSGLFAVDVSQTSGGTDLWLNANGNIFGTGIYSRQHSGATNWRQQVGMEIDYGIDAGATAQFITGLQVVRWSTHAFSPPAWENDTAIKIGNQGPALPAKIGIQIGGPNAEWPIDQTSGRIMATSPVPLGSNPMASLHGIDISAATQVATEYKGRGFAVIGTGSTVPVGSVQVGNGYLSGDTTSTRLDSQGSTATAVAIATGGANLLAGQSLIDDATGTMAIATTVVAGAATVVTIVPNTGYAVVTPANPVTFRVIPVGSVAQAVVTAPTLNVTWGTAPLIQIGANTNTIIGTGAALATNATNGFLQIATMAGAPSGTVGAAGQAAVVIDTVAKKLCYSTGGGTWECSAAFTP